MLGGAAVAVGLLGSGLALPYAVVYDQGIRVLPESPVGGLGLVQAGGNTFPILVVPVLGTEMSNRCTPLRPAGPAKPPGGPPTSSPGGGYRRGTASRAGFSPPSWRSRSGAGVWPASRRR